jgi:hypothetical protein
MNNRKANAARIRQREEHIAKLATGKINEPAKPDVRAKTPKRARFGITLAPITGLSGVTGSPAVFREAKLALLRLQAHQRMERTDTSARKVEEALVPFCRG